MPLYPTAHQKVTSTGEECAGVSVTKTPWEVDSPSIPAVYLLSQEPIEHLVPISFHKCWDPLAFPSASREIKIYNLLADFSPESKINFEMVFLYLFLCIDRLGTREGSGDNWLAHGKVVC